MTPPTLHSGPWPTCCGVPQFFGPHGYYCARRCDDPAPDGGLFPEPAHRPRELLGRVPEPRRPLVTLATAGGVL